MSEELLWHYTDTPGFIGISTTNNLWSTCSEFLKDTHELKLGLQTIKSELEAEACFLLNDHHQRDTESFQNAAALFTLMKGRFDEQAKGDVYVTSFSKHGDSLPQWRAYGQLGYAIGFTTDTGEFHDTERPKPGEKTESRGRGTAAWKDVCYGEVARDVIHSIVRSLSADWTSGAPIQVDDEQADFFNAIYLADQYPAIKHPSFSEEAEVRLVTSHELPHGFRPSQLSGPIPYLEIPFQKSAVRKIAVAPGPNIETRQLAAEFMRNTHFTKDVEIVPSQSSFRG